MHISGVMRSYTPGLDLAGEDAIPLVRTPANAQNNRRPSMARTDSFTSVASSLFSPSEDDEFDQCLGSSSSTEFACPSPGRLRARGTRPHSADPAADAPTHASSANPESRGFPRISRPVELMRNSYDYVVIGSGYGGAIAASRMARASGEAGRGSVCVLEFGKERWPGEYPCETEDCAKEVHVSGDLKADVSPSVKVENGDATGMYHLTLGKGLSVISGNGLGGTSLMNANVFLRADPRVLAMPMWPKEIREDEKGLDKYYEEVERVLEPVQYPDDWPKLPKVELLRYQAKMIGMEDKFRLVPQTTRFRKGPNSCGVEMRPSSLTGQDATGVNDGSKNTTLVTYLADAWNWGAEMFCECEVRYIKKAPASTGGYLVCFAWHGHNRAAFADNFYSDLMWVHAKKCVFLGAGTLGTTEILLRSKQMGLGMSDRVGQNMSGNGDILAFGYNTDYEANAIGKSAPDPYNPVGPTINAIIDNRGGFDNPTDGYIIEDGAVPKALSQVIQAMLESLPGSTGPNDCSLQDRLRSSLARAGSLLFGPYLRRGAVDNTQVYLVMSHDSSQAMLTLKDDKPVLEFTGLERSDHVRKINAVLAEATQRVGGTLVKNPFYAALGKSQATVHPIGGACMARDNTGATGVTNHRGELFVGNGSETHTGLIVTDAAVVPGALGVNPFATISALAERTLDLYIRKHRLVVQQERNGILDLFGLPKHPFEHFEQADHVEDAEEVIKSAKAMHSAGIGFTEMMTGWVHYGVDEAMIPDNQEAYELARRTAKAQCESARLFVSVQAFSTEALVNKSDHSAMLTGTFICPMIPGSPFMVQRGEFNLLVGDKYASGRRTLTYDFDMYGTDLQLLHFHGYKIVDSSVALSAADFWTATSTLYVTITRPPRRGYTRNGKKDQDAWRRAEILAKGVMTIQPRDFMKQMGTLTPTGNSLAKRTYSVASFLSYFARRSMRMLLGPLAPLQYPLMSYTGYVNETPPDATFVMVARDGVRTPLHMWNPTNKQIELKNVLLVPGASVDHQIYATPTIKYNFVNYLTRAGYRVFVSVHRIGQLQVAHNGWTTFDLRLDLRASIEYIRKRFPDGNSRIGNKVYVLAHCMGSVGLSTGMLTGDIPSEWVSGLSCSQVFMNPVWNTTNILKVLAGRPVTSLSKIYNAVIGPWFPCNASTTSNLAQKVIDAILRFYPDERREVCNNASCHRCSLVFGRCWNHNNINEATHRQIDRFFGGVNMTLLHLLMEQGFHGDVMDNKMTVLTSPENVARLQGVPVLLWTGADNAVLTCGATERTYEMLSSRFGPVDAEGRQMYRRLVVHGYGHLDGFIGRNAWKDVYPCLRQEIDRVTRGEDYIFVDPNDRFSHMVRDGSLLF